MVLGALLIKTFQSDIQNFTSLSFIFLLNHLMNIGIEFKLKLLKLFSKIPDTWFMLSSII